MRKLSTYVLGGALALGLAASFSLGVEAKMSKPKPKPLLPKSKLCSATTVDNKKFNFTCRASESCCYDGLMAKGNCVPKGQVCF